PLPETADELGVVQRVLGTRGLQSNVYLSDKATEAQLREEKLDDYRVLYFATHGLLPGELKCQAEPGLVLTPPMAADDRRDDGLLETSEIASLRLNADLVVLSACNTAGSGSRFGGDALSGLAESFFHAGARRLVVSHWQVPSKATAALMSGMFESLGPEFGSGPAHSLRDAQLKLISKEASAHPFFWAAFVVVGDGQADALLPLPRAQMARN
ncbi:MAG: CHAT domain-containing protein, partial [Burkholderiaceae bacterium]